MYIKKVYWYIEPRHPLHQYGILKEYVQPQHIRDTKVMATQNLGTTKSYKKINLDKPKKF